MDKMKAAADCSTRGPKCALRAILVALKPADRADLLEALKDKTLTSRTISQALADIGVTIKVDVIARHRRGDCKCPG